MAAFLERSGYRIEGRNVRVGRLEIDVVARWDRTIVVVEVRLRGTAAWQSALASIGWGKRSRVRRAGERLWRSRYRSDPTVDRIRFDAASVELRDPEEPVIHHILAAF